MVPIICRLLKLYAYHASFCRNKPSIDFYVSDTVGAQMMDGWVGCRVDGDKLTKLAELR
jgi:hypothetical protein